MAAASRGRGFLRAAAPAGAIQPWPNATAAAASIISTPATLIRAFRPKGFTLRFLTHDGLDGLLQLVYAEGLLDEAVAAAGENGLDARVPAVAAGQEKARLRCGGAHALEELLRRHPGHGEVEDDQADLA